MSIVEGCVSELENQEVSAVEMSNVDPSFFTIDKTNLDAECCSQSANVFQMAQLAAGARLYYDELKRKLEVERASLDVEIRKNPGAFGVAKLTETAIASAIAMNSVIIELQDKISHAKYQYDVCVGAMSAVEQKGRALDNLVKLAGMNYFATAKQV